MNHSIKKNNIIKKAIYSHVLNNIRNYIILSLLFIIGVMLGVVIVNNSSSDEKKELQGHISGFIESVKEDYKIDMPKQFKQSMINNVGIAFFLWIFSSTIIGILVVYGIVLYKGFCVGYTAASIIGTLGTGKGIVFIITSLLLQNIIFIPCILALGVSGMKLYKSVLNDRRRENIKFEVYRHTAVFFMITVGLIISSLVETYISSPLLMETIKYMWFKTIKYTNKYHVTIENHSIDNNNICRIL